jgi:hypothetical protein
MTNGSRYDDERHKDESRTYCLGCDYLVEDAELVERRQEDHPEGIRKALHRHGTGLRNEAVAMGEVSRVGEGNPRVIDDPVHEETGMGEEYGPGAKDGSHF